MTKRVVMGVQNDGSIGLRVSQAGFDASLGTGLEGYFTFNSDWTDMVNLYQVGYLSYATNVKNYNGAGTANFAGTGFGTLYTSLGYRPFVEVRRVQVGDVVILDDYWETAQISGGVVNISRDSFYAHCNASTSEKCLYAIYPLTGLDATSGW